MFIASFWLGVLILVILLWSVNLFEWMLRMNLIWTGVPKIGFSLGEVSERHDISALSSLYLQSGWRRAREARGRMSSKGLQLVAREWPASQTRPALAARSTIDFCICPLQQTFYNFIYETNDYFCCFMNMFYQNSIYIYYTL